jgi:hypothetical protein
VGVIQRLKRRRDAAQNLAARLLADTAGEPREFLERADRGHCQRLRSGKL